MSLTLRRAVVRVSTPLAAAALVVTAAPALADWNEPVGGASPLNHAATKSATTSDLTTVGGVPHVVWNEDTTDGGGSSSTIRVARLAADGTSWDEVAGAGVSPISRLSSTSSENPSIAEVDGRPWVAWEEGLTQSNSEIRVARLNTAGTAWEEVPDALRPVNHLREDPGGLASTPTLVSDGGDRPYVSFFEHDPGSGSMFFGGDRDPAKVWVMRLDETGTTWEQVGDGPVNPLPDFDAAFPRMTLVGGVPYVTYFQVEVGANGPQLGVRVSRLGAGGSWELVGDAVLSGGPGDFEAPTIATIGGEPMVALAARLDDQNPRIRVYGLDDAGTAWESRGTASPAGAQAEQPSLEEVSGEPWISWQQRSGGSEVGVAVLRDGAWEQVADTYAAGSTGNVSEGPALAEVGGIPWFSFTESDGTFQGGPGVPPCCGQLRVARLEPELSGSSSQPTDDSATLLTTVEDYGLPFEIGFEYGPEGSFDHRSELADTDRPLFFDVVEGLLASTVYGFRPVATAGTAGPLVTGDPSYFVTDPAEAQDPLVVAIVRSPERVRRGAVARVRFVTTEAGTAQLRVRRDGEVVDTVTEEVQAGLRTLEWTASGPTGRVSLVLRFEDESGRVARDRVGLRVVPRG